MNYLNKKIFIENISKAQHNQIFANIFVTLFRCRKVLKTDLGDLHEFMQ